MIPVLITCGSALTFLLVGTFSLRRAFFLLVALLPFLPYYFAIPIGGSSGGAGLAAARASAYILFMLVMASLVTDRRGWHAPLAAIRQNSAFVFLFVVASVTRFASTFPSQPSVALFYWADELIIQTTVLLLATRVFLNPYNLAILGRIFLVVALANAVLALTEGQLLNRALLAGFFEVEVRTVGEMVLQGKTRYDTYRAQALFDNPLSLAEYLLYAFAVVLFLYKPFKSRSAVVWIASAFICLGISQTGARYPLLLITLAGIVYFSLKFQSRLRLPNQRGLFSIMLAIIAVAAASSFFYIVFNFLNFVPIIEQLFFDGVTDRQGLGSIISRGQQYSVFTQAVFSNDFGGILGEGYKKDISADTKVNLDDYYIRLLIEGGLFAPLSFAAMVLILIMNSTKSLRKIHYMNLPRIQFEFFRRFFLFNILFFSIFFCAKFFLSMNFNNYLLFVFAGAQMAVNYRLFEYERPGYRPMQARQV